MSCEEDDLFDFQDQISENECEPVAVLNKYLIFDKMRLERQVRGGSPNDAMSQHKFHFSPQPKIQVSQPQMIVSQIVNDDVENLSQEPQRSPIKKDGLSRRSERNFEKKNFNTFLVKCTEHKYRGDDLVSIYNEHFSTTITLQGFGRLIEVRKHFLSIREFDSALKKRITYYIKK